jgi:hypothetical protein
MIVPMSNYCRYITRLIFHFLMITFSSGGSLAVFDNLFKGGFCCYKDVT